MQIPEGAWSSGAPSSLREALDHWVTELPSPDDAPHAASLVHAFGLQGMLGNVGSDSDDGSDGGGGDGNPFAALGEEGEQ